MLNREQPYLKISRDPSSDREVESTLGATVKYSPQDENTY